ncbi:unnamed protein product, partial [Tetraodon nigroviridis]
APADAEALCAWLVKEGTVDAVASEDMDTLPFGANILIRQFKSKKDGEVIEYSLTKLLERLQINHQEFVDLCILLGCDYCEKICGLGPRRALRLIQKHRTIENVLLHINRKVLLVSFLFVFVFFFFKNQFKKPTTRFCNRTTQCHFPGSTMKHGRYSWMHPKLHLQNSPGPSQTKKL